MSNQRRDVPEICLENAHVMFRNFRGDEEKYNPAGKRKFCDATTKWREVSGTISSWLEGLYDVFSYGFTMAGA